MATIIDNGGGGGGGVIAGVLGAVLVVILLFLFLSGNLNFGGGSRTVDIDVPAITVQPDGQ